MFTPTITAATTDEMLVEDVVSAKARIVRLLTEEPDKTDADRLANLTNAVAEAEGRAWVRGTIRDGLQRNATLPQIRAELMNMLLRGADDTWSGRTNDAQRSRFDGIRDEVRQQGYKLNRIFGQDED